VTVLSEHRFRNSLVPKQGYGEEQGNGPMVTREGHIAGMVVFVNGFPGCGKTMLTPIVGSMERVELMRFNYHLENLVELAYLGLVQDDVCTSLIRTWTDLDLYHSVMGRETNFRYADISSVFMNRRALQYISRLLGPGDAAAVERIKKEQPILLLTTHMLTLGGHKLFQALGGKLRFVEVVRHPLYMIKQVRTWMPRANEDPRFFFQRFEYQDNPIPWFARGWEDLYCSSNLMDRVIHMIGYYYRSLGSFLQSLTDVERTRFLVIPFERFVIDPFPYLRQIESLVGTQAGKATRKMMKRQNIPRKMWAEGLNLKIYRYYGWSKPDPGSSEKEELERRRSYVAAEASDNGMRVMDDLCRTYEERYLAGK